MVGIDADGAEHTLSFTDDPTERLWSPRALANLTW
jgi:hypothetical protein